MVGSGWRVVAYLAGRGDRSAPATPNWPLGSEERGWRYLLAEGAVAVLLQAIQLKGLPQEGVEGLAGAEDGGGVGRDGEGGHVAQLLQRTLAFGRPVEQFVVLQVLGQALQHGQGLVEVHLEGSER